MAHGKSVDGIDDLIEIFPEASFKSIERLLTRAIEKNLQRAGANMRRVLMGSSVGVGTGSFDSVRFAAELAKALRHRGDLGRNQPSLRQRAPADQGGGRPFHFSHSIASRTTVAVVEGPTGAKHKRRVKSGSASAHMRYVERDGAVERVPGVDRGVERQPDRDRGEDDGSRDRERGRDDAASDRGSAAAPGQGYVENPGKVERVADILSSFGTIGDTADERLTFWELLEQAESHPDAQIQHRLIIELPHETSPAARLEMMKAFCRKFDDDHIPYWVAIHAPGQKNDQRNFHAHVVYSERPAERMIDPANPALGPQWDFAITKTYRTKSRNTKTSRPYRKKKLRTYHALDCIPMLRKRMSDVVNSVLERQDVLDANGYTVRYDHRSYRDMGLDVVPMRAIDRIVADKMKDGNATVLDRDYTKRRLAAELRDAAARRDEDVLAVVDLETTLGDVVKAKNLGVALRALPKALRGNTLGIISRSEIQAAGDRILKTRRRALQIDVMEKTTTASLDRVVAATAPKVIAAAARAKDPALRAEAPAADAAVVLHAAALDELAATKASMAEARRSVHLSVRAAMAAWKDLVTAPMPEMSAAARYAIARESERQSPSPEQVTPQAPVQAQASEPISPSRSQQESQTQDASIDAASRSEPSHPSPPPGAGGPSNDAVHSGLDAWSHLPSAIALPPVLQEISARMTQMIRAAVGDEPDVEKRMDALELMDYNARVALRARQPPRPPGSPPLPDIVRISIRAAVPIPAGPSPEVWEARWAAEKSGAPQGDPQRAASPEGPTTSAPRSASTSGSAAGPSASSPSTPLKPKAVEPRSTPVMPDSSAASAAAPSSAELPVPPTGGSTGERSIPPRPASASNPEPQSGQRPSTAPQSSPAAKHGPSPDISSTEDGLSPTRSVSATAADAVEPPRPPSSSGPPVVDPPLREEHPADAKRRRKREAEEKAAKRRRAVLAKQNRGRGR